MRVASNITWGNFEAIHSNQRDSFEQLCRILFKRQFLEETSVLTSSPNHPGVEVTPIFSKKLGKRIAFQAKFFQQRVDYNQIQRSIDKTIEHYSSSLDVFYLYSNKDLSLESQGFQKIKSSLDEANIEFEIISNNEILAEILRYNDLQSYFFENHTITKDWFEEKNQLSFKSLGSRYNSTFNVTTKTDEKLQLFVKSQCAVDRINAKKVELIEEIESLYRLKDIDLIPEITSFITSLDDITVDDIESCLNWNVAIKEKFETEINKLINMRDKLKKQLETDTNLARDKQKNIFDKIRDIDRLENYVHFFGCSEDEASLIKDKILVINGEAGMGKSQLFATTVKDIVSTGGYAILLLGHQYNSNNDIMTQVMEKFGFNFGFREFLDILDTLGETENKTIYLFIDAINETSDRDVWKNGLPNLMFEVNKRDNIKLALSVRTGYEKLVFEESIIDKLQNKDILQVVHRGFQEDSVQATKDFLDYYNITFSPSDLLNYEMINPLFLKLFCETYNGEEFSLFQMFERFISKVDDEIQKVLNMPDSGSIIKALLLELAKWQLVHGKNSISRNELFRLEFWSDYGIQNKPHFVANLLKSGLVIDYLYKNEEVYSFGYNLLEDYLKALVVKSEFTDKEQSKAYLERVVLNIENGEIGNWNNIDVFLLACYFYYEKFGEDCIELLEKISDENDCYDLANRYIKSFSWRPAHSLSKELFRSIANNYPTDCDKVLQVLVENSTRQNNPINANFLHEILYPKKLAERDGFWLPFINNLTYEYERVYQLITLFDNGNQVKLVSKEQVELLLVLFTWLLASSNRRLRDVTSKAMIEILKVHFELCEPLLKKFENVNDPYIIQRLYGTVFGASVKKTKEYKKEFQSLAEFVYLSIFSKEFIYPDILLRDYAKLIIERFFFEFPNSEIEIIKSKIFPPYNSMPVPTVNSEVYENDKIDGLLLIDSSMRPEGVGMYGDFGRYIFQSALTQFKEVDVKNLYHYAMQFIRDELEYTSNQSLSDYDCGMRHPLDRSRGNLVERIGKKYQWIAFYNILARISDHHKLREWDDVEDNNFKGPWEHYVRDFDPTLNYHALHPLHILPKFNIDYDFEFLEQESNSDEEIDKWIYDKPSLFNMPLSYKDDKELEWVLLYQHKELKIKPDKKEKDSFGFIEGEQRIWRIVEAYFIKNVEVSNFIKNVQGNKFLRNNISRGSPSFYQFFNREFVWSSSVRDANNNIEYDYSVETGEKKFERQMVHELNFSDEGFSIVSKEKDVIVNVKKIIAKLLPSRVHFLWEEEYDLSKKETISFDIPCAELINQLNLSQKEYDGYFYNSTGDLVSFDGEITDTINGLVIRRDFLDKFLKENDLSVVWDFVGEKQYFTQNPRKQYYSRWEGVFWDEQDSVKNKIYIDKKRTTKDELL